jgi:hypothetical protein
MCMSLLSRTGLTILEALMALVLLFQTILVAAVLLEERDDITLAAPIVAMPSEHW